MHGWTLVADDGVTGRTNCIAPLAFDGSDLETAIDEAIAWQAERNTRPCFKIAEQCCTPAALPETLAARGWAPQTRTLVMTAALDDVLSTFVIPDAPEARSGTQKFNRSSWIPGSAFGRPGMTESVLVSPDYLSAIDAIVRETAASDEEYAERSGIARRTPQPRRFARIARDGATAAIGLSVVTGAWAAIFLMRTHPAYRRQGLARDILAALAEWAKTAGAAHLYLQVEAANAPAIALYRAAAFETAYSYSYWRPEPKP